MKANDKILTELNEVIQYFINHKDNEPKTEFCNNVDKLINLQADLANGVERSSEKCHIQNVSCRFSDADVRNIVLEMQNAAMYAHSHNLSRFETRIELQKVKKKWKL